MKQGLLMFVLILAAVLLGACIGDVTAELGGLEWLAKGYDIGITSFDLDLKCLTMTFGFEFHICIAQVLLILVALPCYLKLKQLLGL